jgi:hypothetical protein
MEGLGCCFSFRRVSEPSSELNGVRLPPDPSCSDIFEDKSGLLGLVFELRDTDPFEDTDDCRGCDVAGSKEELKLSVRLVYFVADGIAIPPSSSGYGRKDLPDLSGEGDRISILGGDMGMESAELYRIDELSLNGGLPVFCCDGNPYDAERSYRPRGDSKSKGPYGIWIIGDDGLEPFLGEDGP